MSYLLSDPSGVLWVSGSDAPAPALEERLLSDAISELIVVESVDDALTTLGERQDIGAVVVTDGRAGPLPAACQRLRDHDGRLPVVVYTDPAASDVIEVTQAGASTVVERGDVDALVAALADATDRYERQRREHAESSMFQTLLEEGGTSIYVKDTETRHLRLARVPGAPDSDHAIGKTDEQLYGDTESADETRSDDERVVEDGDAIRDKVEHFEAEGSDIWTETTKIPWHHDGEIRGLVGVSRNITEEVKKEHQLETFEERFDNFASQLSHDLKTPLQVASGQLTLARETGDEAAFEKAETALQRMEGMIDDMSSLAHEGKEITYQTIEKRGEIHEIDDPTDIGAVIDEVWDVVGTDEATIRNHFPPGAIVVTTEAAIRPSIENLVRNAVVHAGPDVTVEIGPLADWSGFYIADDGPGIPPEEREDVFDEGYTTHSEGTGTGLAIVAESLEKNGWTVEITDSESGGARFEIGNCPTIVRPESRVTPAGSLTLDDGEAIGGADPPGAERYDEAADRWTVEGSGANIWRDINEFRFVHTAADGPVRIEGQITDPAELSEYSKTGFMIRDDCGEDASYGAVGVTPQHGTELLWRSERGGDGVSQHFEDQPLQYSWYRIDRVDDVVTCYCSSDRETWHPLGQRRIETSDPVEVGLYVCSCATGTTCEGVFENVSVERLAVDGD